MSMLTVRFRIIVTILSFKLFQFFLLTSLSPSTIPGVHSIEIDATKWPRELDKHGSVSLSSRLFNTIEDFVQGSAYGLTNIELVDFNVDNNVYLFRTGSPAEWSWEKWWGSSSDADSEQVSSGLQVDYDAILNDFERQTKTINAKISKSRPRIINLSLLTREKAIIAAEIEASQQNYLQRYSNSQQRQLRSYDVDFIHLPSDGIHGSEMEEACYEGIHDLQSHKNYTTSKSSSNNAKQHFNCPTTTRQPADVNSIKERRAIALNFPNWDRDRWIERMEVISKDLMGWKKFNEFGYANSTIQSPDSKNLVTGIDKLWSLSNLDRWGKILKHEKSELASSTKDSELSITNDQPGPTYVFFHCLCGCDRTGVFYIIYELHKRYVLNLIVTDSDSASKSKFPYQIHNNQNLTLTDLFDRNHKLIGRPIAYPYQVTAQWYCEYLKESNLYPHNDCGACNEYASSKIGSGIDPKNHYYAKYDIDTSSSFAIRSTERERIMRLRTICAQTYTELTDKQALEWTYWRFFVLIVIPLLVVWILGKMIIWWKGSESEPISESEEVVTRRRELNERLI